MEKNKKIVHKLTLIRVTFINISCFLLGNKTLCEMCTSKLQKKSTKKKVVEPEEEEGLELEGTPTPLEPCRLAIIYSLTIANISNDPMSV